MDQRSKKRITGLLVLIKPDYYEKLGLLLYSESRESEGSPESQGSTEASLCVFMSSNSKSATAATVT